MFKLVKILGGRINQAEPRRIRVQEVEEDISAGTPISIINSHVTVIRDDETNPVTHILEADVSYGEHYVTVIDVLPGMVFSAPIVGAPSNISVGVEYMIKEGGLSGYSAPARGAGGVCFEDPEATDTEVLMTFRGA